MLVGFIIGYSYSGGPLKLGFRGLGEMVIFIMFGPLMMTGVYYAITGEVTPKIVWLSAAVGLLVTNIVYTHSVLDAVPDKKMGKFTMAHLMGSDKGMLALSSVLNLLPYILVTAGVILGQLHIAYLAVLLVLPVSVWLVKSLSCFVSHVDVPIVTKWWMGPMGDFDRFRKAGLDWFMLRWLVARNIVQFFCLIAAVVSLIFG
jgi:1,4-dihydroxy-2-naphthoate octaprenyltransferase